MWFVFLSPHLIFLFTFVSAKHCSVSVVFLFTAGSDDDDESEKEEKKWEDQQIQKAVKQVFAENCRSWPIFLKKKFCGPTMIKISLIKEQDCSEFI